MTEINNIKMQVRPILKKSGISHSFIFGSYARRTQKKGSDLDLMVKLEKDKTLLDLAVLKMRLEKKLGIRVDVLTPDSVHPDIRAAIMKEKIEII